MTGGVFISYRRTDSRHAAGRLFDQLLREFDAGDIFMDVDGIEPGLDFVEVLNERVSGCQIVLAVIGPNWLTAADEHGRRLDDPDDFVRIELEAALQRNIRLIPVLVDGAAMPKQDQLPDTLKPLTRRQAVTLTHEKFLADSEIIVNAVSRALDVQPAPPVRPARPAPAPAHAPRERTDDLAQLFASAPTHDDFRVAPSISANAERNARHKTRTPDSERVFALIDLTVFNNGNDCVLFTDWGARWHHLGNRDQISWQELAGVRSIAPSGIWEVALDNHKWTFSGGDRDYALRLFTYLRDGLAG